MKTSRRGRRAHRRPEPRQRGDPALRLHRQPRPALAAGQCHGLHRRTGARGEAARRPDRQAARASHPSCVDRRRLPAAREDLPEAIGFIRASTQKMDRLINAILSCRARAAASLTPEPLDMDRAGRRRSPTASSTRPRARREIVVEPPARHRQRPAGGRADLRQPDRECGEISRARPRRADRASRGAGSGERVDLSRSPTTAAASTRRDHERIFDLFRRSGRRTRPGEGIGLAYVRALAASAGPSTVESELGRARHSA